MKTRELIPHDPEHMITKILPVTYDPEANRPLWQKFIDEVTGGNDDIKKFLQVAIGYSLTGDIGEEKLFFVHGPAATGKSTFLEAIKSVMGEYSRTADFEAFLKRSNTGGPRNDIARLAGSRFVTSIEVDEGKKLAEGLVKMITGGDTISARFLYKESFEFTPQLKLFLAANHAPQVDSEDEAMWRRIVRIPFDEVIPVEKRDPALKKMLKDIVYMGPTILNWAIEGCIIWQKEGLMVPDVLKEATSKYREDMDPISEFLEERCIFGDDKKVSVRRMRNAYEGVTQ